MDRNRSAHPNLIRESEEYSPSAEQVRLHIRNAIEILLSRPPVQGKAALALIHKEVDSAYFPIDENSAYSVLLSSPIARAKANLVITFVRGGIASCIKESLSEHKVRQRVAAYRAVARMHPSVVTNDLVAWFPTMLAKTEDSDFPRLIKFLARLPELEERVDKASKIKIAHFVENLPTSNEATLLPDLMAVEMLKGNVRNYYTKFADAPIDIPRIKRICEGFHSLGVCVPKELIAVKYENSGSFDKANSIGTNLVIPNAKNFGSEAAKRIIGAMVNVQVSGSFEFGSVLSAIKVAKCLTPEQFDAAILEFDKGRKFRGHLHVVPKSPEEAVD